ncbi:hypothetical protein [Leminorella grimontii]|uniref:hypothetical protein n=1 Tax=Leminorella grimontii TaxID=82981 RepID=UPI00321F821E
MKIAKALALIAAAAVIAGCSSNVKEQDLQTNAAFALGVDTNKVAVSNVQKSGVKTTFNAQVGKKTYSCYVTSTPRYLWIPGAVSDAICSGGGKKTCDALSQKAGRC